MKIRFKDGKKKVITLSYDDAVVQDIRLIEIMNKYGLKGTFNVNSGMYLPEDIIREKFHGRLKLSEAKEFYINSGHEIAVHAFNHPFLENLDDSEIIYEITEDRRSIEEQYGVIARGMAYPYGTYSKRVISVLEKCKIAYARTTNSTYNFKLPQDWLELHPTCHHKSDRLCDLIKEFVENSRPWGNAEMFYLWGHSYEFDNDNNWEVIERFASYAGGRDDIWYATNIEIYDYVKAYESLQTSYDKKIIHNPSAIDVWAQVGKNLVCIDAGATVRL